MAAAFERPRAESAQPPGRIPGAPVLLLAALVLGGLLLGGATEASAQDELACQDCHDVDPDAFADTVHGFLDCTDCHAGAEEVPHPETVGQAACADCHDDAVEEFLGSIHGTALDGEQPYLTGCKACHGEIHALVPRDDPSSPISPTNHPQTCGACHADPEMAQRFELRRVQPVAAYLASVHAHSLERGEGGATCSSCHGSHSIFPASDPRSTVFHSRVPETCGQCHGDIAEVYARSIHGQAVAAGIREAPVCTDCHGEHRILSPEEEGSPVFATNIPKLTCGNCHGDVRLAEKFGLDPEKVPAYEDSYHGLAARAGSVTVAHCGSCHGIHDILPSSDPDSHIYPANLPETCGKCHPGAGRSFAIGPVHVLPTQPEHAAVYWIRTLYLWLIVLTVGGMVLHNGLDLFHKVRHPPLRAEIPESEPRERMPAAFRLAHGLFGLSFILLAYSGFALKYPEAWWAEPLLMWESSFSFRGWLHRSAAVVMVGTAVFHLVHMVVSPRARACLASFRPRLEDVRELRHRLAYYVGLRSRPPAAPWVGYPEKLEYVAVIWGTILMAATGFLLWFENLALAWLPKWALDVATVIHFYEAILACLAILVWHFYFVIFDPVVYPMDTAFLTGRSAPGRILERREGEEGDGG